jgi:hypothetical protein
MSYQASHSVTASALVQGGQKILYLGKLLQVEESPVLRGHARK